MTDFHILSLGKRFYFMNSDLSFITSVRKTQELKEFIHLVT